MMMPSIFGENLFDDFMNDFSFPTFPNEIYSMTLQCSFFVL